MIKLLLTFGIFGDYNDVRRLTKRFKFFYPLYKLFEASHCSFLPLNNEINGKIIFPHGAKGCFFSTTCSIGVNCTIMQHVTIGSNFIGKSEFTGGGVLK